MNNIYDTELPKKYFPDRTISDILHISDSSKVYKISSDNLTAEKVLKITPETNISKQILDTLKNINDPHILTPEQIISCQKHFYITMEYKECLTTLISTKGISLSQIINISLDISTALNTLHGYGILHMDCTPDNIYRSQDGSYCLGDFCSAIKMPVKPSNLPFKATPDFIPPEIQQGNIPSVKSDIYIFSMLLYCLCNDGYTYSPCTDISNDVSSTQNIQNNIPPELYQIITRGLNSNPEDRYPAIKDMYNALINFANQTDLNDNSYFLHICDTSHPLYYLKTQPLTPHDHHSAATKDRYSVHKEKTPTHKNNSNLNSTKTTHATKKLWHKPLPYIIIFSITAAVGVTAFYYYDKKYKKQKELDEILSIIPSEVPDISKLQEQVAHMTGNATSSPSPSADISIDSDNEYHNTSDASDIANSDNSSDKNLTPASDSDNELNSPQKNSSDLGSVSRTYIDISNKKLSDIKIEADDIEHAYNITCLYAHSNALQSLAGIERLYELKELYLSDNQLTDVSDLVNVPTIETLVLSYNDIQDTFAISLLPRLKHLDLSGNRHITQPELLSSISTLELLNITDTNISKEQYELLKRNLPNCTIIY